MWFSFLIKAFYPATATNIMVAYSWWAIINMTNSNNILWSHNCTFLEPVGFNVIHKIINIVPCPSLSFTADFNIIHKQPFNHNCYSCAASFSSSFGFSEEFFVVNEVSPALTKIKYPHDISNICVNHRIGTEYCWQIIRKKSLKNVLVCPMYRTWYDYVNSLDIGERRHFHENSSTFVDKTVPP